MIAQFLPDIGTIGIVAPTAVLLVVAAAAFVGWLRIAHDVRAPYTRKVFHFIIISAAMPVQLRWGLHGTIVYAGVIGLAVLFAVWRGRGFAFYEALARPTDVPHATLFILVPLTTTALGGLLTNIFFPAWVHVGYLVVAWGDAIGEPVGTRWGKHRYQVRSLAGVPATRSLEGSASVLAASAVAALIAIMLVGVPAADAVPAALIIGCASALVEAVSNHGIDNLTVQLTAAGLAAALV